MTKTALVRLPTQTIPLQLVERFPDTPGFIRVPASPPFDVHALTIGWKRMGFSLVNLIEVEEPPSPLHVRTGETLSLDGETITATGLYSPPELAAVKAAKKAEIDAKRDELLNGGFTYDFGGEIGEKVLQTRNEDDKRNWLVAQTGYSFAAANGNAGEPGMPIRTEDNATVPRTNSEGLATMLAMAAWGGQIMQTAWALKDALNAAPDEAAVVAIDVQGAAWVE